MMKKMTKHPLRITLDALKRAFLLEGFELFDNGESPELVLTGTDVKVFENPDAVKKPVLLMDGQYALRTQLLPYVLPRMDHGPAKGTQEIRAAASGKIFDGEDAKYPAHMKVEGVIASDMNFYDMRMLWKRIVRGAFGAAYETELVKVGEEKKAADMASWGNSAMAETTLYEPLTWQIQVNDPDGCEYVLGHLGTMNWMGAALLGRPGREAACYAFSIDAGLTACRWLAIENQETLYSNRQEVLSAYQDGSVSASTAFEDRCRDVLRTMGYSEGYGPKLYPDGIYKKMNMIQDEWDLNNKGVPLKEALGANTGLPTVLTPAIEQILSEKWAAGETRARAFEISHIFVPRAGGSPIEKLALSFGAYGDGMNIQTFTEEVSSFLTKIGNKNHFFIPTNLAIAYNVRECRLILDEKMSYLDGNFGGISEKAEKNFGIGTHAFMANLELGTLEKKAREEYGYIPPELR